MKRLILVVLLFTGCGSLQEQYVEADKATYDVVSPYLLKSVEADDSLDEDQKEDWRGLATSWGARIEQAKGMLEETSE